MSIVPVVLLASYLTAAPVPVVMRVDATSRHPISRYIYGLNFAESKSWGSRLPRGVTLSRMSGNRMSAYNWETNASNCGNDCGKDYPNDAYFGTGKPGQAVRERAQWAFEHDAAFLAPVSMLGHVAGDTAGPVRLDKPLASRLTRFKVSKARKGAPFTDPPDLGDGYVYQDEFVAWLEAAFPSARTDATRPIFYSLDNEPDLWGSTHEEVRGNRKGEGKFVLTGYDELIGRSVETATAIKDVAPQALVFGPVLSGWNGFQNLYHNDPLERATLKFFLGQYLAAMKQAGEAKGRRLLDVLDVHWYAEATSTKFQAVANEWAEQDAPMVTARVQAPRSLWDPTFKERSWISDVVGGPIRLLPRLRELIDANYPGTRLAVTEYYYYRGGDISGGLAQADTLGIFGREDVFAATLWNQGQMWAYKGDIDKTYACIFAAFRAFRDYDGQGGAFGDTSLGATTTDVERTSIYASTDAASPGRLVLVLLNKSDAPVGAIVALPTQPAVGSAEVWRITGGVAACSGPEKVAEPVTVAGGRMSMTLPPLSINTVVLK